MLVRRFLSILIMYSQSKESASLAEIRFTNDTTIVVEHSLDYLKDALEAVNL